MTEPEIIRSRGNAKLKRVGAVAAGRDSSCLLLEGERLVTDAVDAGIKLELLLLAPELADRLGLLLDQAQEWAKVEGSLLSKVGQLETSPGVLALARRPAPLELDALELGQRALLLVVAGLADPGNLGALARSAEAAGVDAMCLTAGGVSPWNPKALRGSMGSLLRLPVLRIEEPGALARELAARGLRQVTAATRGGSDWRAFDWSGPLALWISGERGDQPECCREFEQVSIPTAGRLESLNATVAAALLLFAAGRVEKPA